MEGNEWMVRLDKWDLIFQNYKFPCFMANSATKQVFYMNEMLKSLLHSQEDALGKTYYEILNQEDFSVLGNLAPNWDQAEPVSVEVFSKSKNLGFHCTFVLMPESDVIFCTMKPLKGASNSYTFEERLNQCLAVLHEEDDQRGVELLRILGEFYDADKAYLYLVERKTKKLPCKFSWTRHSAIHVTPDLADKIDPDEFLQYLETRNEAGIIDSARVHSSFCHDSFEAVILNAYGLENIVMAVVEDNQNQPIAMVIVSNRKNLNADFRLLQAVTRLMERDITKSEVQSTIDELNDRDILTGFFNRTAYASKVDEIVATPPKRLGVFLANVNGLKKVNNEYGYAKGDSLIKKAADVIKAHFGITIYRVAGDEFVAFFPDIDKLDFEEKVLSLRDVLKQDDAFLFALGHAWGEGRYECGQLISQADTMMYINKQEYYHSSHRKFDEISDTTLSDLLSYLNDGEFMIYLQPQVRLKDGSLYGAEALIRRFDKKNQKMVFPDQFISMYEQKSVIRHVDMFVVDAVCQLLQKWGEVGKALPISVNLSRVTLLEYGIVNSIVEICDKYQVPHQLLVIEVTERVGLIENNVASGLITAFKNNGFNISLDDFGCAYSNIVTLAQIEVDEVKIDKSLVDDLTTSKKNHILVKNVLSMCNELDGASTLAEGIEDEHQARLLYELGCHLGQGYYYSRPIPVDDFIKNYLKIE